MNIHSGCTSYPFTFYVYTTLISRPIPYLHAYKDKVPKHANLIFNHSHNFSHREGKKH